MPNGNGNNGDEYQRNLNLMKELNPYTLGAMAQTVTDLRREVANSFRTCTEQHNRQQQALSDTEKRVVEHVKNELFEFRQDRQRDLDAIKRELEGKIGSLEKEVIQARVDLQFFHKLLNRWLGAVSAIIIAGMFVTWVLNTSKSAVDLIK